MAECSLSWKVAVPTHVLLTVSALEWMLTPAKSSYIKGVSTNSSLAGMIGVSVDYCSTSPRGTGPHSRRARPSLGIPSRNRCASASTMRYVDVTSNDLQREYHLARAKPRHITPQPKAPTISPRTGFGRRHRLSALRSTCHRDVPAVPARWPSAALLRSTFQSAHQNPRPNPQTQPARITGRDWPYKSATRRKATTLPSLGHSGKGGRCVRLSVAVLRRFDVADLNDGQKQWTIGSQLPTRR